MEATNRWLETRSGRILFCSHTKAAAQTAAERWGAVDPRLDVQTLHSYCFRRLALQRTQTVDDAKMAPLLAQYGLDLDDGGIGKGYANVLSVAQALSIPIEEAYDRSMRPGTRDHFLSFAKSYSMWKEHHGFKDFGDMLIDFTKVDRVSDNYSMMVVDEAQDLSPLHWRVIDHLIKLMPNMRVMIGGDDDQCIYSYAGADAHGPRRFIEAHGSRVTVLAQSYRVPKTVHALAEKVADRISLRINKTYRPTAEVGVVQRWGDFGHSKIDQSRDTLILFSDKFIRKDVEDELADRAIPYEAFSGMPAPLQNKGARAIREAMTEQPDLDVIRRGLSPNGLKLWDSVGPDAVIDKLRAGQHDNVNLPRWHSEYYRRIDWSAPIKVRISTIHGAKGYEADEVHLLTDQSAAAIDYERVDPDAGHRLFYVGVTRARFSLQIYEGNNGYPIPVN